eukprot:4075100-Karenia_brevis.AAC.1
MTTLTDIGTNMNRISDMKLTWVWLAVPIFTDIGTDLSQLRHWARHVGTDFAKCWLPGFTNVEDGSWAPGKPNAVRGNVGTDV